MREHHLLHLDDIFLCRLASNWTWPKHTKGEGIKLVD